MVLSELHLLGKFCIACGQLKRSSSYLDVEAIWLPEDAGYARLCMIWQGFAAKALPDWCLS